MKRVFVAVGIATTLSVFAPFVPTTEASAIAQEWRSRADAARAADRDRDRGWRGQGNAGT
jgi:hypothetical protein